MDNAKKSIFYISFIFNALQASVVAGGVLLSGCAAGTAGTKAEKEATAKQLFGQVAEMVYCTDKTRVDSLAPKVDQLRERFMAMPGSHPIPAGLEEKWRSLAAEAERLQKWIHSDEKLEYLLGELNRIGIFFSAPDAAHTAEYYLARCVGMGGGTEERDYRPSLSLAWLNLHEGCQISEKTRDLLEDAVKKAPDWERPYLAMLWGYYYYSCRHDPEKALPFFQTYLAFDPHDERVRKIFQKIKK
ncbi:MAG: hypothetical protein JXA71_13650 [Chitinispirillaceae bacterium]|nr:hypothetical protein [Chitinispirillaceae bacterium]